MRRGKLILVVLLSIASLSVAFLGAYTWYEKHTHPTGEDEYWHGKGHGKGHHPKGRGKGHAGDEMARLTALPSAEDVSAFEAFERGYAKVYPGDTARLEAFAVFQENSRKIEEYNKNKEEEGSSMVLKMNQFGDMTLEKFTSVHLGVRPRHAAPEYKQLLPSHGPPAPGDPPLPEEIDWAEKGAVRAVKNQGQCGSCWSFSTTGALEGAFDIVNNEKVTLSEQQFVDCDGRDNGCNGGEMDVAFAYAETHSLCTEDSYAYDAEQHPCNPDKLKTCKVGVKEGDVYGFRDVTQNSAAALQSALAKQPVSIAIAASSMVFQFYHDGVLDNPDCGTDVDHGVLAVGYGTDKATGKKFWKVKNSWGTGWGKAGYLLVSREVANDDSNPQGMCAILSQPSYPEVKKKKHDDSTSVPGMSAHLQSWPVAVGDQKGNALTDSIMHAVHGQSANTSPSDRTVQKIQKFFPSSDAVESTTLTEVQYI